MRSGFSLLRWLMLQGMLLSISFMAQAESQATYSIYAGTLQMAGEITMPACTIDTGSAAQIIQMGSVSNTDFSGAGSYSEPVPFHLRLTQCDTDDGQLVQVGLRGESDARDPHLLRIYGESSAVAMGVGLALFDAAGTPLIPGAPPVSMAQVQNGITQLDFHARYRAVQTTVSGGEADASAWLTVSYQ